MSDQITEMMDQALAAVEEVERRMLQHRSETKRSARRPYEQFQQSRRRAVVAAVAAILAIGTTPPMGRAIEAAESVASPHLPKAPGDG